MIINPNFKLRKIAGETIVVNQGTPNVNLTRIISLNDTASLLYEELSGKNFSLQDAAKILIETYNIPEEQATKDAKSWIENLNKCGVIE